MASVSSWKKNVSLFMAGQGISLFGSMMVHYAVMWHITLKTQSGLMMTLITVAGALPMFFISPFGGVWADRYNKKYIINIADAIIAIVTLMMAVIFSLGFDYAWLLLICLVMRALGQGVQMPAVNALIPELVPQEHLLRVNGINSSVQSIVMFASPMAGGALLAIAPIQTLMFIDVLTAAIGIGILLLFVKTPVRSRKSESKAGVKQHFIEIGEGLKYMAKHPFVKKLLVMGMLFNILYAPASILTQLQVVRDWGDGIWSMPFGFSVGPEQRLAALNMVFFVGMMLGGLVMGVWGGFKNKSITMTLSLCLFGISVGGLGLLSNFWMYLLCIIICGLMLNLCNAPMIAILQTSVDGAYMGRVFSVLAMISSVIVPLGMAVWGPLADVVAIDWILLGTGALLFLMGFVLAFDKKLLEAGMPREANSEPMHAAMKE